MNSFNTHKNNRQLHKFGGSSLANVRCYQRVAEILSQYSNPGDLIVVSAAGKTTDQLISWLTLINTNNCVSADQVQQTIKYYQCDLIKGLLEESESKRLYVSFIQDLQRLTRLLVGEINDAIYAEIVGHGEIWSARLMTALLNQLNMDSQFLDARDFLRAERTVQPKINVNLSLPLLRFFLDQYPTKRLVMTGFISRNNAGETVLLGRNGSDYSATQIGSLAAVKQVTIWSDVAGVYSADPQKVKNAYLLPLLRLDEANELARLSAPILHTRTLQPVISSEMDLLLRCSYNTENGYTRIQKVLNSSEDFCHGAKIILSHDNVCLIELMINPEKNFYISYEQVYFFLHRAHIIPIAIGLHSKRRLIQLCYTSEVASSILRIIEKAKLPAYIYKFRERLSLIALVGDGVTKNIIHKKRFYQQLKCKHIEFIWKSEKNISLVAVLSNVESTDVMIQNIHNILFTKRKRIGLILFGKGNIASSWLKLFSCEQNNLSTRTGLEFSLIGVVDSQRSLLNYEGLDAKTVLTFFNNEASFVLKKDFFSWMRNHPYDELVILDITASPVISDQYLHFAKCGFHVISANKLTGSAYGDTYYKVRQEFSNTNSHWLYNATVGAGLPINYTIRDLIDSGDKIVSISGIFSGTLSWLFLQFNGEIPFTKLVEQAWRQGLTEPDPRIDLSGQDVMRKLIILIREAGYAIEPNQVVVESMITLEEKQNISVQQFFTYGCTKLDKQMLQRFKLANQIGLVLRYVARFDVTGEVRVGIETVSLEHPMAQLLPCDNVFIIKSLWYQDNPLVIRGPGAGQYVTAGAIQSDLNRLAHLLL